MLSERCGWEREKRRIPVWSAVWWWTRLQRRSRRQPTAPWFTMQPRRFLPLLLFLPSPFSSSPGLFNSAHPIIRNLEWTSSRLFLVARHRGRGRTDRWWSTLAQLLLRAPGLWAEGRSPGALAAVQECLAQCGEPSRGESRRGVRWPSISLWGGQEGGQGGTRPTAESKSFHHLLLWKLWRRECV